MRRSETGVELRVGWRKQADAGLDSLFLAFSLRGFAFEVGAYFRAQIQIQFASFVLLFSLIKLEVSERNSCKRRIDLRSPVEPTFSPVSSSAPIQLNLVKSQVASKGAIQFQRRVPLASIREIWTSG